MTAAAIVPARRRVRCVERTSPRVADPLDHVVGEFLRCRTIWPAEVRKVDGVEQLDGRQELGQLLAARGAAVEVGLERDLLVLVESPERGRAEGAAAVCTGFSAHHSTQALRARARRALRP